MLCVGEKHYDVLGYEMIFEEAEPGTSGIS